jgi:hypothetical protein
MRKNQEIENELHELSPELAKIPFTQVYETPEGYFEELPISLLKNVEEISTNDIPEDYFESLPNEILSKLNNSSSVISIQKKYFYLKIAVAAVAIGILGIGFLYFLNHKKTDTPPAYVTNIDSTENYALINSSNLDVEISNLNEEDVINFLEENGHDVNAALVASLDEDNTEIENNTTEIQVNEVINEISLPTPSTHNK